MSEDDADGDAEDHDDHDMLWEVEARHAVKGAIQRAEIDDVRGTVTIRSGEDHRYDAELNTFEELSQHLQELYDEHWYAKRAF